MPDFIVPGFPKCGTTWLYDRLRELPEFDMPPHKELHFFNRDKLYNSGEAGSTQSYLKNRKRLLRNFGYKGLPFMLQYIKVYEKNEVTYKNLFNQKDGLSGDITPVYILLNEKGVEKMSHHLNGVKIVFILRDPVDRAWSQFRMYMRKNNLTEIDAKEAIDFFNKDVRRRRGSYASSITNFQKYFTDSQIMVTFYDVLQKEPKTFLENIVQFLGKSSVGISDSAALNQKSNVSKKYDIDESLYKILIKQHKEEYEWLISNIGSYSNLWYNLHFGEKTKTENYKDYIIL